MQNVVRETDRLQRIVSHLIATSPAGVNLLLIGGFRYRLLDNSQRFSVDIDYHWDDDIEVKQQGLVTFCKRSVLEKVRRETGYDGSVSARKGPDADSPNAKFIDLRFWNKTTAIEIPVELTRILRLDPTIVKTASGTVYVTASDADIIESKILAALNRIYLQHRDLVDIFLHGDNLRDDSKQRLKKKIEELHLQPGTIERRLKDLETYSAYHAKAVDQVITDQVDPVAAQQIIAGGGGRVVLESAVRLIRSTCAS